MAQVNSLRLFKTLVSNENDEPDLVAALRAMTDEFRGSDAWHRAEGLMGELETQTNFGSLEEVVDTLFRSGRLTGDRENYDDPDNSFIDHCLATGKGLPITLSLIARLTAERSGVQCALIGLPGHVVIGGPEQSSGWHFYDPFNNGRELSRAECLSIASISGSRAVDDILEPMTNRAILIRVLNNLARTFQRRRDSVGLSRCVAFRLAMPEIRRADGAGTMALVRELN